MGVEYTSQIGKWEKHLNSEIERYGSIFLTLFDPEKLYNSNISPRECAKVAYQACKAGVSANMIGGSTGVTEEMINSYAKGIRKYLKEKEVYSPVIGFPAGSTNIGKELDAIWFMSMLNSEDLHYIVGAQIRGAPIVKRYNLEAIPMAYLVVEPGGTVGHIGRAKLIPRNKPELAVNYALAAQYMGFRFVYLEGGSGIEEPVPNEMISAVKNGVEIKVGTGGGIKIPEQAREKAASGADFIFVGTKVEELIKKPPTEIREGIEEMVRAIREGAKKRKA